MHVVMYHPALRMNRSMYSPYERSRIHDVGLGDLDGFNVGKMFKRMFTFKPSSFTFKNIMGSVGSLVSNVATFGAASAFAPKTFGAHSKTMQKVGMGVSAAAAVGGGIAIGSAFGPGILSAAKTVGSSLMTGIKTVGGGIQSVGKSLFGGGSSGSSSSGWSDPTGGTYSSSGGSSGSWLDAAGKVLETGAKVMAITSTPAMTMPYGVYDNSGTLYAPQPIVTGNYPQVTGVAENVPNQWYPTVEQQALMHAGQAGAGQMPGGPGMNAGYYNASGGPVEEGVIRNPDGTVESSTIISGVSDKHVYIGGGVLVLGLLYALS